MRLIDADAYKDYICRNCVDVGHNFYGAKDISKCPCGKVLDIDYFPTAYDVDKVVEELWNLKHEYIIRDMPSGILIDAIKVVKRGGVDER